MRRSALIGLFIISAVLGCVAPSRFTPVPEAPSPWPFHRGDLAATGSDTGATFSGKLTVLWQRKLNDKPAGPITIANNMLYYPSSRKKIRVFDPGTGKTILQFKTRGLSQAGTVAADSMVYFGVGAFRYQLVARNLRTGKTRWEKGVKDASGGPILWKSRLFIGAGDGFIRAFDQGDGREIWSVKLDGKPIAPVSLIQGKIIQPTDRGILYALSPDSGRIIYKVKLDGPTVGGACGDQLIFLGDVSGEVYGISPTDGRIEWRKSVGGPIWSAPAVAQGRLFVTHSGGEIVVLDALTGAEIWRHTTINVVRASPLVAGRFVIVGTLTGKVMALAAADGTVADTLTIDGPISVAPMTDGTRIYIATDEGRLTCFGEADATNLTAGDSVAVKRGPE